MTDQQQTNNHFVQLPLLGNVAIYARVVTHEKLIQNGQTQEDCLTQFATQLGYEAEQVTVFADEGTVVAAPLLTLVHQFRVNCMRAFDVLQEARKLMQAAQ